MNKCVLIINQDLSLGLIANTAAVLAVSLGRKFNDMVGEDVFDKDGSCHQGITQIPITILRGDHLSIQALRNKVIFLEQNDLYYVDFCDVAQRSKHYSDYTLKLAETGQENLKYLGLAIYGPTSLVNSFTGNIGLLR
jgi:hypothetical protein